MYGGAAVAYAELKITLLERIENGYILAFAAGGATLDGAVKAITTLDPWQRSWIPEERVWWIADEAITLLARRLPAVAESLEQLRRRPDTIADHIAAAYAAAYSSTWRAIYIPAEVKAAYGNLGLPPGAPEESVVAAKRTLARRHHPDAGGDHTAMVAVNTATDTVMTWLKRQG
jgi:hypothetical protein